MNQTYYKQNFNKFSFGELKHYSPNILAFPGLCAMKILGLLPIAPVYAPLPINPCFVGGEQLSTRCREAILPSIESFQRLGFEILGFEINAGYEDPNYIGGGGCHLVHPTKNFVALVTYNNFIKLPTMPSEFTTLTVWTQFENNHGIGLSNHKLINYFHCKIANRKSFRCEATSPFQMLPVFEKILEESGTQDATVPFRTLKDLSGFFEKQGRKILEAGLKNGRFVPMSKLEIIQMKQARVDKQTAMHEQFEDSATVRL
jgi:hypothetical protein